jgi:predicted CXXCH cytochrome family protein
MAVKIINTEIKYKRPKSDLMLLFVILLTIIFVSACSTTRHHNVLSFFFDGVPSPAEEIAFNPGDSLSPGDSTHTTGNVIPAIESQFVYHTPVKEKQCDACHDHNTMGTLILPQPEVCYQCHADFNKVFQSLHGPVAGGYCTACHDPHMSTADSLLLRTGQSLCLYCHNSIQVLSKDVHTDIGDAECTMCHNPHGGDDRYMLR